MKTRDGRKVVPKKIYYWLYTTRIIFKVKRLPINMRSNLATIELVGPTKKYFQINCKEVRESLFENFTNAKRLAIHRLNTEKRKILKDIQKIENLKKSGLNKGDTISEN